MSATKGAWEAPKTFQVPDQTRYDRDGNNKVVDRRGLFVLHSVLLHTGKVLVFCGHVESFDYGARNPTGTSTSDYTGVSYVYDPDDSDVKMTPIYFPPGVDLFCCHYVQLPDGRILVVGGSTDFHKHDELSYGIKNICYFDPVAKTWELSEIGRIRNLMHQGRWYPTAVMLGSGKVAVFSGRLGYGEKLPANGIIIADKAEIIAPMESNPHHYDAEVIGGGDFQLPLYPGMHLSPNGKIYFTGTTWGQEIRNPKTRTIQVVRNPRTGGYDGEWKDFNNAVEPNQPRREEGMSVLLHQKLPTPDGKILLFGGTHALNRDGFPIQFIKRNKPTDFEQITNPSDPLSAEILNTMKNPLEWKPTSKKLAYGRVNGHAVLLPDETTLIAGGHNLYKWLNIAEGTQPSLVSEIFDGSIFTEAASMKYPRMYHSTALLLPDGRVMVSGGADPNEFEPPLFPTGTYPTGWKAPTYSSTMALNRKDYEIYKPPYFWKGERPKITRIKRTKGGPESSRVTYDSTFVVESPEAAYITKVAIMRPGAPTHHTDSEQRYVELEFKRNGNELTVTIGDNRDLAPPGYYMLWIMREATEEGTSGLLPCERAKFVHLVVPDKSWKP